MSTTFAMDEPAGFSISAFEGELPYVYTRWGNPTIRMLEEKLAALEGAEDCVAFASGMAATAAVMLTIPKAGDHLVISDVNYAGTAELARNILAEARHLLHARRHHRPGSRRSSHSAGDADDLDRDPGEPDPAADGHRRRRQHRQGTRLAVDSTFATPIATRPVELGVDFVVHSLTKYIGGHGDALGGAVLGTTERLEPLRTRALVYFGGVLSPFNA